MRWLLGIALVGCASAGTDQPGAVDSGTQQQIDSKTTTMLDSSSMSDASMTTTDAPVGPMTRTLSQTTSTALKAGNSIACGNALGTRANNYYRVFDLPAMGITTPFSVSQVSFQIEHCHHNSNIGCTLAVRVGTYAGTPGATLSTAAMTILASNATVPVPEIIENPGPPPTTPGGTVNAPITATIPANSKLLVQIEAPEGQNTYSFYMGSNDGGESGLGYILAPATGCAITTPTNISTVGTPAPRHLLITVTGTY
jgi:hypothetical protein